MGEGKGFPWIHGRVAEPEQHEAAAYVLLLYRDGSKIRNTQAICSLANMHTEVACAFVWHMDNPLDPVMHMWWAPLMAWELTTACR